MINQPYLSISIHAPLRERQGTPDAEGVRQVFQSTLPYGSDQLALFGFSSLTHFNPRSLAGATVLNKEIYAQGNISIHAPSRERRYAVCFGIIFFSNFNPRSLAGATLSPRGSSCDAGHFNPRSLAGATCNRVDIHHAGMHFNPRSLAGATSPLPKLVLSRRHFNPRSLAGATQGIKCIYLA